MSNLTIQDALFTQTANNVRQYVENDLEKHLRATYAVLTEDEHRAVHDLLVEQFPTTYPAFGSDADDTEVTTAINEVRKKYSSSPSITEGDFNLEEYAEQMVPAAIAAIAAAIIETYYVNAHLAAQSRISLFQLDVIAINDLLEPAFDAALDHPRAEEVLGRELLDLVIDIEGVRLDSIVDLKSRDFNFLDALRFDREQIVATRDRAAKAREEMLAAMFGGNADGDTEGIGSMGLDDFLSQFRGPQA